MKWLRLAWSKPAGIVAGVFAVILAITAATARARRARIRGHKKEIRRLERKGDHVDAANQQLEITREKAEARTARTEARHEAENRFSSRPDGDVFSDGVDEQRR